MISVHAETVMVEPRWKTVESRVIKLVLERGVYESKKKRGLPKRKWLEDVKKDLNVI